jgi:hypothetical protein
MKKVSIICILCCFMMSACKKSDLKNLDLDQAETTLNEVLKTSDKTLQKSMYKLLDNDEKAEIWKLKFTKILKTESLDKRQIAFINLLIEIVKPELFDNLNDRYRNQINDMSLKNTAIELFGLSKSFNILATLNESEYIMALGGCKCSKKSDWCEGILICRNDYCEETSGCGTFWSYTCNGGCYI